MVHQIGLKTKIIKMARNRINRHDRSTSMNHVRHQTSNKYKLAK